MVSQLKLRSFFSEAKVRWIIYHCECSRAYLFCAMLFFPFYLNVLIMVVRVFLKLYDGLFEEDYANLMKVDTS